MEIKLRIELVKHKYVDLIPADIESGVLYISKKYNTASHLCCCGCGEKVVTPLKYSDWSLIDNGNTVSLSPSIGNWSFRCQSHYWIINNRVVWASKMSYKMIEAGRAYNRAIKKDYYEKRAKVNTGFIKSFLYKIINLIKELIRGK